MTRHLAPVRVSVEQVRDALKQVLPERAVVTDDDVLRAHSSDQATWVAPGRAAAMVRAREVGDVQAALRACHRLGVPVVPRGAGSGLSGGATATDGCVILDLSKMDSILEIDDVERLAVVEPGVLNGALNAEAGRLGLWYPPDPASRAFSTVGGNVATNAGGLCCVKYGVTRDWVSSLEVVLADGRRIVTRKDTRRDAVGYDATGLIVGSEGTLGVVTRATLRLRRQPGPKATAVASFPTLASVGEAIAAIVKESVPSLLELIDGPTLRAVSRWKRMDLDEDASAVLIMQSDAGTDDGRDGEVSAVEDVCREAGATFTYRTADAAEAELLLEARRLAYPALERLGATLLDDIAVPVRQIAPMLRRIERIADEHGVRIFTFGHAGEGSLHPTIVVGPDDAAARLRASDAFDSLLAAARESGGTVTGEHGVGVLKARQAADQLGSDAFAMHAAIKAALDPRNILNPGKVLA